MLLSVISAQTTDAQTLEKMNWFNEPDNWQINGGTLTMDVTPNSDYWRISHYGFTVDDAPFYYAEYGGEFEAKVKITGDYKVRFDQAGMMIRLDHENYIKIGIEFVDGRYNLSTVVTHRTSDWSVIALDRPVEHIWIKAVRRLDAVEIFYSFDDKEYHMMRNAWIGANHPVRIGMFAALSRRQRLQSLVLRLQGHTPARQSPQRMAPQQCRIATALPITCQTQCKLNVLAKS